MIQIETVATFTGYTFRCDKCKALYCCTDKMDAFFSKARHERVSCK